MIVRSVAEAEAIGRIRELSEGEIDQVIKFIDSINPNALAKQRETAKNRRRPGALNGHYFWMSDDFDAPMEFAGGGR